MKILSISTASQICSVAVLEDNNLIKELSINDENTHSQKLMPLVDKLFQETNLSINDIDVFAGDIGPGSFTGIRIGVATLKAFSDVTSRPTVGISSLEGLVYNIPVTDGQYVCALLDARNNNAYCGIYKFSNNRYEKVCDDFSDNINKIIDFVKTINNSIIFVGNGSVVFKDMIESQLVNNVFFDNNMNSNLESAYSIGKAAFNHFINKDDNAPLVPLYLRPSNAERLQEKKL